MGLVGFRRRWNSVGVHAKTSGSYLDIYASFVERTSCSIPYLLHTPFLVARHHIYTTSPVIHSPSQTNPPR